MDSDDDLEWGVNDPIFQPNQQGDGIGYDLRVDDEPNIKFFAEFDRINDPDPSCWTRQLDLTSPDNCIGLGVPSYGTVQCLLDIE